MPGAVPRTSTIALTNTTMKFALNIANYGLEEACKKDAGLAAGVNVYGGKCVNSNVAESLGLEYVALESLLV